MKLEPNRPYKKLKDCAGQKFIGGSLDGQWNGILVFESAWCWVSIHSDDEEGPRMTEHQWSLDDWSAAEDAVRLGLLTREQVDEYRAKQRDARAAADEARERREYERLKKKFEAQP